MITIACDVCPVEPTCANLMKYSICAPLTRQRTLEVSPVVQKACGDFKIAQTYMCVPGVIALQMSAATLG